MTRAQMEGEDSPILDIEPGQDVGHQAVPVVIDDQSGVFERHQTARVAARADQHAQCPAGLAGQLATGLHIDDQRHAGQTLLDRGQQAGRHVRPQGWRFLIGSGLRSESATQERRNDQQRDEKAVRGGQHGRAYYCPPA